MNSKEDKVHVEIKNIIDTYLRENRLPKLACLTNCLPGQNLSKYLTQDFNYICFCVSNHLEMSRVLFLQYFMGYRKITFDVFVATPESYISNRQFGYICLKCKDAIEAQQKIKYVSLNKSNANRKCPILLRIICDKEKISSLNFPENTLLERKLADDDIILKVR